jgi:uncharacterized protein YggE
MQSRRTNVRRIVYLGTLMALLGVALGFAACGDDDNDNNDGGGDGVSNIRTDKGLAVAALAAEIGGSSGSGEFEADDLAAPSIAEDTATRKAAELSIDRSMPFSAPALQASPDGITVTGYGSATADADSAIVEFYFGRSGGIAEPGADGGGSSGSSGSTEPDTGTSSTNVPVEPQPAPAEHANLQVPEVQPITEAELQPVIDALVAAGIPRDQIEYLGQGYYDPYFASATLRATVADVNAVDGVVNAASTAAAGIPNFQLQSTHVSYTVSDCAALERAAMEVALEDARERGEVMAEVLGVGLGAITGAANYSYAPYGGTPCDTGYFGGPIPLGGIEFAQGQPREVQVFAQLNVTFAMQ